MPARKAAKKPRSRARRRRSQGKDFPEEFGKQLEKLYRNMVKPMPIRMRVPAALLGVGLMAFGGWSLINIASSREAIIVGNRILTMTNPSDSVMIFLGVFLIIVGYMVAHRALEGVWL